MQVEVRRVLDEPIVHPGLGGGIGTNINGPSLVRAPAWRRDGLGDYYLYFADHKGEYIRLAFADALPGPWRIHEPGALHLRDTPFLQDPPEVPPGLPESLAVARAPGVPSVLEDCTIPHIASPEVVVDEGSSSVRMYYHGLDAFGRQVTRVAVSEDGLRWRALAPVITRPYLRVFELRGLHYGIAMPGVFYRSPGGLSNFEPGPKLFDDGMRHCAVWCKSARLWVFWTRVGDAPERIWLSEIDVAGEWWSWRESEPIEVLRPELPWEGADLPCEPSVRSASHHPVNQLRDPALFRDATGTYLLYVGAGEAGIGIARIEGEPGGDS